MIKPSLPTIGGLHRRGENLGGKLVAAPLAGMCALSLMACGPQRDVETPSSPTPVTTTPSASKKEKFSHKIKEVEPIESRVGIVHCNQVELETDKNDNLQITEARSCFKIT